MSTDVVAEPGLRLCHSCGVFRPVEEFRRRSRHSEQRVRQCRECYAADTRLRRQLKRRKQLLSAAAALHHERDRRRFIGLTSEVVRRFGGVSALADRIIEACRMATPDAAGRREKWRFWRLAFDLMIAASAEQQREGQANADRMALLTDADVQRELDRAVRDVLEGLPAE